MANNDSLLKRNGCMEDIAAEIGYTAANSLVDWLGGEGIFIPEAFDDEHMLCRILGAPAFKRLIAMYSGRKDDERRLWVPYGHERDIARRDRMIGAMLKEGKTVRDVAKRAGMTERHVQQVRVRLEEMRLLERIFRTKS